MRAQTALAEVAPPPPPPTPPQARTSDKNPPISSTKSSLSIGAPGHPLLFPTGETEDVDDVELGDVTGSIPGVGRSLGSGSDSIPMVDHPVGDIIGSVPGWVKGTDCNTGVAAVGALGRLEDLGLDVGVHEHTAALFACAGDECGASALAVLRCVLSCILVCVCVFGRTVEL